MTTFFIIRHGKTLFNEKERLQGWCDSPLTADGFAQMKQLSEGLKDIDFSAIYTSTSPRAMTCAEILAEDRDLELQPRDSLREIGYGSLEGEYLADAFPEGRLSDVGYAKYNGEDLYTAQRRFIGELQQIASEYPDDNVAVVTHGHLIKTLLGSFTQQFAAETIYTAEQIPPCSVTVLKHDNNRFSLDCLPDISWRTNTGFSNR